MASNDEIPENARNALDRIKKKAKRGMETKSKACGKRETHEPHDYKVLGVTRRCNGHRQ